MVFIVKWSDGRVALVAAVSEADLFSKLDQQGDPYMATWQPFDGDLWIELGALHESLPEGDVSADDEAWARVRVPPVDSGNLMVERLRELTTPHALRERNRAYDAGRDTISRAAFDSALEADRHIFLERSFEGTIADYWGPE